jgi:CRP-like cAMP-binding protein
VLVDNCLSYFDSFLALGRLEKEELSHRVVERQIKRRHFVLQENEVCQHYTFVRTGCFRLYALDQKGTEHILQFAAEGDWIADLGSFYTETPSHLYLEALEPATILQLAKPDLLYLYRHYPRVERHFRVTLENKFVEQQQRLLQTISATAEARYLGFLAHYPTLAHRLAHTQIASYLGITPEFFSKLRRGLADKKLVVPR